MFEICKETWDKTVPKDFRPYFTKAAKVWRQCERGKGAWVGWGSGGNAAHGISL